MYCGLCFVITGLVTTLAGSGSGAYADGQGTQSSFYNPNGVALDSMGTVYVGDSGNIRIRKVASAGEWSGRWTWTVLCCLLLSVVVLSRIMIAKIKVSGCMYMEEIRFIYSVVVMITFTQFGCIGSLSAVH